MSHRFTYAQYLQRIQRRGSENCKKIFTERTKAQHLRDGKVAVILVVVAVGAFFLDLHIGALMCAALAIPVIILDIWDRYQERRQGF